MEKSLPKSQGKKQVFSKKILALLAEKPAISVIELTESFNAVGASKYALTRSIKGLTEAGLIEAHHSGRQAYTRLTRDGRRKAYSIKLESDTALVDPLWDGKWRIIMLDLPEDRKAEREGLRYLLKKAGFIAAKNSVWISRYPFEHFFTNIKKDLGLTTEIMIFVTDTIDTDTEAAFLNIIS